MGLQLKGDTFVQARTLEKGLMKHNQDGEVSCKNLDRDSKEVETVLFLMDGYLKASLMLCLDEYLLETVTVNCLLMIVDSKNLFWKFQKDGKFVLAWRLQAVIFQKG